jgi:plasmid stability protein
MRKTSFDLPDELYRHVNLAAASMGMSSAEYIRCALVATLATHAEHDPIIKMALQARLGASMETREAVSA